MSNNIPSNVPPIEYPVDPCDAYRIIDIDNIAPGAAHNILHSMLSMVRTNCRAPINLLFRSYGGSVTDSMAMWDAIKLIGGLGPKINGVVHGYNMSAGVFLLQACDVRRITENSIMMIHGITESSVQMDRQSQRSQKKLSDHLAKIYINTFRSRSSQPDSVWDQLLDDNTPIYLTAHDALEWGLVDEVVPAGLAPLMEAV